MEISYFTAAGICLLFALLSAALVGRIPISLKDSRLEFRIVLISSIMFSVIYASLSSLRYYQLIYGMWDFGVCDITVRNTAHFQGFLVGLDGGRMEHFSPLILFWVPFYWIWDSPYVLIIGQSVLLGAAAIPLYFCCRRFLHAPGWPLLIVSMYLLNPYLSRFTLYEYHMGCFYPLLFFSAWLALSHRRHVLFLALLFGSVLAKESFCIVTIAVGLYLCSRRKHLWLGLACLGITAVSVFFILNIWFPYIVPLAYHHTDRFPVLLGNGLGETFKNFMQILHAIYTSDRLAVLLSLMIPFAFLPLLSWRIFLLLILPVYLVQIFSLHSSQKLLMSHYSDVLNPLLPIAAMLVLTRLHLLKSWLPGIRRPTIALCVTLPITAHVMFCELPHVKYNSYIPVYRTDRQLGILSIPFHSWQLFYPRAAVFHEIKDSIPKSLTVCAQNNLAVFFVRHKQVYHIKNPQTPDVYVFDIKSFEGYDSIEVIHNLLIKVSKDPGYGCVYNLDGFIVFYRRDLLPGNPAN